jgi:hypothetical protein
MRNSKGKGTRNERTVKKKNDREENKEKHSEDGRKGRRN